MLQDVTDSVGHQVVGLMILMRREVELRMAAHGLTDAQWKPLWMLKTGRATTSNEVARLMDVDASAVTRLVDRLEAKGLLARVRSAADRRVVHLALTPAGEDVAAVVPEVLAAANADFLRGFSDDEVIQLKAFIARMTANGLALAGPKTEVPAP